MLIETDQFLLQKVRSPYLVNRLNSILNAQKPTLEATVRLHSQHIYTMSYVSELPKVTSNLYILFNFEYT